MALMIWSIFDRAMSSPFKMWTFSCAFFRSNSDLRRMTSIRCWTKFSRSPGRLRIFGWLSTMARFESPEAGLERRILVQVVQDDRRHRALAELEDNPDAILVGLVADIGDAVDLLVLDHLGNGGDPLRLVHLVRELGDDDPVAPVPALGLLDGRNTADDDPALAGLIDILHTLDTHQDAAGREVGAGHDPQQFIDRNLRGCRGSASTASQTSRRLCGGILVAIPTAIPSVPLTSRFGIFAGRTVGSSSDSS